MKKLLTFFLMLTCWVGISSCSYEFDDKVKGVSLSKESLELYTGDQETLTATIKPTYAYNKQIKWNSEDKMVASVIDGLVTAITPGETTITVTTIDGGFVASCNVTVKKK